MGGGGERRGAATYAFTRAIRQHGRVWRDDIGWVLCPRSTAPPPPADPRSCCSTHACLHARPGCAPPCSTRLPPRPCSYADLLEWMSAKLQESNFRDQQPQMSASAQFDPERHDCKFMI